MLPYTLMRTHVGVQFWIQNDHQIHDLKQAAGCRASICSKGLHRLRHGQIKLCDASRARVLQGNIPYHYDLCHSTKR